MAQDYTEYLAVNVLNEQQYVSYRNLSRALKVHSNLAKQMLYEFHHKQNSKKPGSVHATYLITGTKHTSASNGAQSQDDGEDSIMQSSPPMPGSSMPKQEDEPVEVIRTTTMMLVKEEYMDRAREQFEHIAGIHIYSLQANTLKDIHVLTECNRRVASEYASEDPLKAWKQYGTIQNPSVKRRTGTRPPPPAQAAPIKPESVKQKAAVSAAAKSSAAEINSAVKPSAKNATSEKANSMSTKATATKKQGGGIFSAFAKGAAKPKKSDSQQGSAAASPVSAPPPMEEPEDVPMTGFSDDDDDDGEDGLPEELEEVKAPGGKSKKDRKAELQAMMQQEDEPMEDATKDSPNEDEQADQAESQEQEEPKETVEVENGRRRGRRRVMKKKTVKDEEGYLVTREEAAWESFSEEEPAPKKPKVQAPAGSKPAASKKGAKPGQGNIMSFFSKK